MVEAGHADAPDYPVAMVFEEVELVVERENQRLATEASLMKAAIDTGIAAFGKNVSKVNQSFRGLLKKLSGSDDPEPTKRNMDKGGAHDGSKRRSIKAESQGRRQQDRQEGL